MQAILLVTICSRTTKKKNKEGKMSGLYLIQVTISICIMDGFDGQTLYEDSCNRVDEMNQRFNEAYGKI